MFLCPPLLRHTAHLWQIDLEPEGDRLPDRLVPELNQPAASLLSAEEFAKARRFVTAPLRLRYTAAHIALRLILGGYLAVEPKDVLLSVEKMGRPIIDFTAMGRTGELHFNLTHSDNLALVAVCAQQPIGVDVERVRAMDSRTGIERQVYTAAEIERLQNAGDSRWFAYWTAKEAVLKATGYGFYLNPLHVHLDADIAAATAHEKSGATRWLLYRCEMTDPWSATVAVAQPLRDVVHQVFPWTQALGP